MSIFKPIVPSLAAKRAQLLSGVGTAVLVVLSTSGHAAETLIQANPNTAQANAGLVAQSILNNQAPVFGAVTDTAGTSSSGVQTGTGNEVTTNTAAAAATGNTATTRILETDALTRPAGGEAALSMMSNSADVSSRADRNRLDLAIDTLIDGSAVVTGNTVSATTTVNSALTRVDALIPAGAAPATVGTTTINSVAAGGNILAASGDIVVTNAQTNLAVGSAAVTDNHIGVDVGLLDLSPVAPVLASNTIAAAYTGNSAANTAAVGAGGSPTFTGSVVVTNMQSNDGFVPDFLPFDAGPTATAMNSGSSIAASAGYSAFEGPATGSLAGSLAVTGNQITAAATGNTAAGTGAGNRIIIADGISVDGTGNTGAGSNTNSPAGDLAATATADLTIVSGQRNSGTGVLSATTTGAEVVGDARSLIGGSVAVAANTIGADATGNTVTNAVQTGTGAAAFGATIALASQQVNIDAGVAASSLGNATVATAGNAVFDGEGFAPAFVDTAAVSLTGNVDHATAYGNTAKQNVAITATTLPLSGGTVALNGFGGDASTSATGGATVTNSQNNINSPTTATVDGSLMLAESNADVTTGSRIAASTNTQEAIAIANTAATGLALTGTTVGSGAGIGNAQVNRDGSATTASLAAVAAVSAADATGSTLALTDNVQRAIAYGNSATNAIGVTATQVALGVDTGGGGFFFGNPTAFATASQQTQDATISATVTGTGGPSLAVTVGTGLAGGAAINDGNALVAAAYGNQAANGGTFDLGAIAPAAFGGEFGVPGVASVVNVQFDGGLVSAAATGGEMIAAAIGQDVTTSSVSVSGNTVEALAYANRANGNTLTATGTDVTTANPEGQPAFVLGNYQQAFGSVVATTRSEGDAASIGATVGRNVADSAVVLADNLASTQATGNAGTNTMSLAATTLGTTAEVISIQYGGAQVSATAGQAAVAATPGTAALPFAFNAVAKVPGDLTGTFSGGNATLTGGILTVAASSLTSAQIAQLLTQNWTVVGSNLEIPAAIIGTIPGGQYLGLVEGDPVSLGGVVPASAGTPGHPSLGGVHVAIGGDITGSSVRIADNGASVGAVVNNATNALTVAATQVDGGVDPGLTVANQQTVFPGASATADIIGAYLVTGPAGPVVDQSAIAISGNSQVANAVANAASNSLTLAATNVDSAGGTTAIHSNQSAFGNAVTAASDLTVAAPASSTGSTVALTGNTNTSLGVVNDVTNKAAIVATNVTGVGTATAGGDGAVTANYVVDTTQEAQAILASSATTTLGNNDAANLGLAGVRDGSVTVTGNVTTAEASANRALNTATVTGSASQSASAALSNRQNSGTNVTAVAATTANIGLTGVADLGNETFRLALENGSVALNGNTTTALARGNAATNTMTVAASTVASVPFGPTSAVGTTINGTIATATAPAVVLNSQTNNGSVGAQASAIYAVALNSDFGAPGAAGSSVAVGNNVVNASAYGNTATNGLQVTAVHGTGIASGAVANYQQNNGAVTAAAQQVTFGTTVPAGAFGSAVAVGGNQVSATAIGNSVVTTLTTGR